MAASEAVAPEENKIERIARQRHGSALHFFVSYARIKTVYKLGESVSDLGK